MNEEFHRVGEFELIARYFAPLAKDFPGAYGLLDDVAVIVPSAGNELVVKTDAIVGGVHFLADDPADLVARKALRVNLSDLAAKAATPRAYLLDLVVPFDLTEAWIAAFARGLAEDQREYGIHLIGGDTDRTPGPPTIAITALGEVAANGVIRRGGALAGDTIYVTGSIGDAALGLRSLRGEMPGLDPGSAAFLADRYRLPQPRVTLGPRLMGIATASIDVSDGLVADLCHLCKLSRLAAVVEADRVPLSGAARAAIDQNPDLLDTVVTGGDDYEILFSASAAMTPMIGELSGSLRIPITAIGRMVPQTPEIGGDVVLKDADGRALRLGAGGWRHF